MYIYTVSNVNMYRLDKYQDRWQITDHPSLHTGRDIMTQSNKGHTLDLTSGHESQKGLETKTDWLTVRQSQRDLDLNLARLIHRPDDGGSKDLWNVVRLLLDYASLQLRRHPSSYSLSWEPQILETAYVSWGEIFFSVSI
jgi:hypothetical protein